MSALLLVLLLSSSCGDAGANAAAGAGRRGAAAMSMGGGNDLPFAGGAEAGGGGGGGGGGKRPRPGPEFVSPMPNITVAVGRDAVIPCVVKNLHDFQVAFVHLDRQMILTIHHQVITRVPRFSITHDKHHTWSLHIKDVQEEDKGHYMCQINTDPMVSDVGILNVVVPPQINDLESSPSSISVRENNNASLLCKADGTPEPTIRWRREDKHPIIIKRRKKEGKKEKIEVHGEVLDLIRISRTEMGAYLCIAQNGVPPSISKRIILTVEFVPMVWVPEQLVGAPLGTTVKLQCHIEASPKAISYWAIDEDTMVLNSDRFQSSESHHSEYKLDAALTIRDFREEDVGKYRCVAKNSLGDTEGSVRLYQLETSTTAEELAEDEEEEEEEEEEDFQTEVIYANHDEIGRRKGGQRGNEDGGGGGGGERRHHRQKEEERRRRKQRRKQRQRQQQQQQQEDNREGASNNYWYQDSSAGLCTSPSIVIPVVVLAASTLKLH